MRDYRRRGTYQAGHGGRHKLGGAGARAAGWPAGEGAGDTTGVMHAGPDGCRSAP